MVAVPATLLRAKASINTINIGVALTNQYLLVNSS